MKPHKFADFIQQHGEQETYTEKQIFHAQDYPNKLFLIKSGYVKRYQASNFEQRVLELIYGPGHIVSLSQLYKMLFGVDQNHDNFTYVYQAMTDVVMYTINADVVVKELEKDPELYKDFFYESGIKLRSNILRLASNSIKDTHRKVAHQIASLAYEFADVATAENQQTITLPLPQSATDIAEQLNISEAEVSTVLDDLTGKGLIKPENGTITIVDFQLLQDVYL